ncbi:hypothetical protein [Ensifer oleiphilus]|uniref:hypothetical protein n=1 Tax=Ensifer oleiphilus TaxID=2742698 RepID=UPI0015936A3D|nr:hypothetical protein [Ensifer oleiphilus]
MLLRHLTLVPLTVSQALSSCIVMSALIDLAQQKGMMQVELEMLRFAFALRIRSTGPLRDFHHHDEGTPYAPMTGGGVTGIAGIN